MATRITDATRNAACDAIVDLLDGGAGAATVKIYTGSQPATAATAASGTLLATFTCADPAFGSASAGVATADTIADVTAGATGTAGWFRAESSTPSTVIDGSCGTSGSGADMILNTASLTSGGTVSIDSWTVTVPSGA